MYITSERKLHGEAHEVIKRDRQFGHMGEAMDDYDYGIRNVN